MNRFDRLLWPSLALWLVSCADVETEITADASAATDTSSCVVATCPANQRGRRESEAGSPSFRIGTNEQGKAELSAFTEAVDGADVSVVVGQQLAYMVVVGAVTDAFTCCDQRFNITATVASADGATVFGTVKLKNRQMSDLGDGRRYLPNVFLVVGTPDNWKDQKATLTVELEPYGGGTRLTKSVSVTLRETSTAPPATFGVKVGTNTAGETDVSSFIEAKADARVPIVIGPQGAYMMVLAAATDRFGPDADRVNVSASLVDATGTALSEVALKNRPLFAGPNGVRYLLNVWMVLGDVATWAERPVTLHVDLEPSAGGDLLTQSVPVVLYDVSTP